MQTLPSIFKKSFPSFLENEIDEIFKLANVKSLSIYPINFTFKVIVGDEILKIPCRHNLGNFNYKILFWKRFSPNMVQSEIINCFYTRHCNGYIREEYLKKIILLPHEWVVPYVLKLLGEYVVEILDVIHKNMQMIDMLVYKDFISKNQDFYNITRQRVISYWDCYYRWLYKYKHDYVGFKILNFIENHL